MRNEMYILWVSIAGRSALIDGLLEFEVQRQRLLIGEGQYLCSVDTAESACLVDPIERVGKTCPAKAACCTTGGSLFVVDHECQTPSLWHASDEFRVERHVAQSGM